MCVIAIKKQGVEMPNEQTLKTMWTNNPHGAGIMYARDGHVYIDKGYMDWTSFSERIKSLGDLTDTSVVMHFRIATHGGVIPGNTHPFPVSRNVIALTKLRGSCKVGVAHNGIISCVEPRKGISDTMEYIATKLAPRAEEDPDWYKDEKVLEEIGHEIKSKLAALDGDGVISYYGDFIEEADGMIYSNDSYKPRVYAKYTYRDAAPYTYSKNTRRLPWDTGRESAWLMPLCDIPVEWDFRDPKLRNIDVDDLWVDHFGALYVIDYDLALAYRLKGKNAPTLVRSVYFEDLFDWEDSIRFEIAGDVPPEYWV